MSVSTHIVAAVCRVVKDLNGPGGSDSRVISKIEIALIKETYLFHPKRNGNTTKIGVIKNLIKETKCEMYRLTPAGMAKLDTNSIDPKKDTTTIIEARCPKKRSLSCRKRKRPCLRRRRRRVSRRKTSCSRKRTSCIRPRRLIKRVRPKRPKTSKFMRR